MNSQIQLKKSWKVQHCRFCAGANTSRGFQDCVEQETFNNSAKAQRGVGFQRFVDPSLWTWDVTAAIDGRCFTLNFDEPLTIDLSVDSLVFNLEEDMVYYLFIHQPDFFILTYNPLTMPAVDMLISFNETGRSYLALILEVIKYCPWIPELIYRLENTIADGRSTAL